MVKNAVVLAGGFGTRLGDLTKSTPKPLLPVGGRPFISILVDELRRYGLNTLIIAGFEGQKIADHFNNDPDVRVIIEPVPLGTGGALRFALDLLEDRFFLLNGDTFFDFNLLDLCCAPGAAEAQAILSLREVPDASRYETVDLRGGKVERFVERRPVAGTGLINCGASILARSAIEGIRPDTQFSLEKELFPELAANGAMLGRVYSGDFIDIGVPADYERSQWYIPSTLRRGAVIFDRDGVLNEDVGYAHRPDQIRWIPGAREAVKMVNDAGLYAFVATNQAGVARGYYEEPHIHELHGWMNAELNRVGAHIDAFEYSPFHPAGTVERYSRASNCRKPGPDMLVRVMDRYQVARDHAVMVGDKPSDLEAASAAGIHGIRYNGGDLRDTIAAAITYATRPRNDGTVSTEQPWKI